MPMSGRVRITVAWHQQAEDTGGLSGRLRIHIDDNPQQEIVLLALVDFHAGETAEGHQVQAADFRTAKVRASEPGAREFSLKQVALAQLGIGQIGGGEVSLAKA